MTIAAPSTAPALFTPDDHVFKSPPVDTPSEAASHKHLGEEEFRAMYEVDRTVTELLKGGYNRVALQFPDERLGDSERVYSMIHQAINDSSNQEAAKETEDQNKASCRGGAEAEEGSSVCCSGKQPPPSSAGERKVFILADTSYSACCVDEIAAEHASADVLVHYGRSCLSPTERLPVIYVFTTNELSVSHAVAGFQATYPDVTTKVLLMSDVTYTSHTAPVHAALQVLGYINVFATSIIHNPASLLPNRTLPPECHGTSGEERLREWALFHLSEPLPSLLLILASRVASIHYFLPSQSRVDSALTSPLLRRRYALLSHAKSAGIIGILVNTLNIKHYLPMISRLKQQIREAGRKSYLVVVGKVNVEKVANFSEIEVWVGVGCWEQGVVGGTDGRGWYRPVITPWELGIALGDREWNGGWIADFSEVLRIDNDRREQKNADRKAGKKNELDNDDELDSDEDAPPEFDLKTGRYISTTRPLGRTQKPTSEELGEAEVRDAVDGDKNALSALITTSNRKKELVAAGGVISPAAQFLREQRTWQGLGSDLEPAGEGALVEEGRSGVARGYIVGQEGVRH